MWFNDGGSAWNDTKCIPVVDDPAQLDAPCTVEIAGDSGIDDCDVGLMCWDTDAENEGTCVALCLGSPGEPTCASGDPCTLYQYGFGICIPSCDPLMSDCDPDSMCIPSDQVFVCVLDASGDDGQVHTPCMFANGCDPGLYYIDSASAKECDPMSSLCCEPFCDVSLPNTCPGEGQECIHWYEGMAPSKYENLGICTLPG